MITRITMMVVVDNNSIDNKSDDDRMQIGDMYSCRRRGRFCKEEDQ